MLTSDARIQANIKNAQRSTGPTSPEGKARSMRNGMKHGMTGQGIVIPEQDAAEVDIRHRALHQELAPQSIMGAILVGQMATLSVRMERGAKQEFAAVAIRVRHASDDFDAQRIENAKQLFQTIGDDPRGIVRQLLKSPEGVEIMDEAWHDLRAELTREPWSTWVGAHGLTMAHLLGLRESDAGAVRIMALSKATWGNFASLADSDGNGLEREARQAWARARLLERIDAEIAELGAHYETLDFETIELDRAEAGARALFDPSKEAALARRYEAEARRGFFRSLKEFRKVEAEAADQGESAPPVTASSPDASLASSCQEHSPDPDDLDEAPIEGNSEQLRPVSPAVSGQIAVDREENGQLSATGRRVQVPACS